MDCATTGIEPDFGLKKSKKLIDGSTIYYVNPYVAQALTTLGYDEEHVKILVDYANTNGHLEGSTLKTIHLPVFDCAQRAKDRQLSIDAHLDMVAAVQPFLSGAISKTCNLSHEATIKDVMLTYLKSWERKIKCVSIYRDGSKLSEPMRVKEIMQESKGRAVPKRERLPNRRVSVTEKFTIQGQGGYLTVGHYPDGRPGETFIRMAQHGSTITGLLDAFATAISIMLQYGIKLEDLALKFKGMKFPPAGMTDNPDIRQAESIIDFVFKWLELNYCNGKDKEEAHEKGQLDFSAQLCPICGNAMIRTGTCLQCQNCSNGQGVCS
jgi:ribonucleoside-diphosphate reductase alpha chain